MSSIKNCASTVWHHLWEPLIFQSLFIHPISDMVNTHSSLLVLHLAQPPPSIPRGSNNPKLVDFLKSMAESMKVLRKQNEDLNTQLIAAKARSNQKEKERTERRKKSGTEFTEENGLLILISRIMRAQSKGEVRGTMRKNHPVNLVGGSPQMADRVRKDLTARSLFMRALLVRIMMKRSLIDRDVIETSLFTISLGTATKRRR